ncbi:LysR family transcriptional regulator [Paucibacter sp. Y2R2-4]|uniref:LysR family transcriptional regulator n=1 Tax=Paucibacter sp. Y2R2-4 TaxID=2893553 RepID=UPI0021E5027E|nr:LysR family transcriptional regulator [Paucibacter sp. Y2R2-4]MCV2351517.1 LysR family transcriptional regulator [Paucibacter sp. Y2R2-4]
MQKSTTDVNEISPERGADLGFNWDDLRYALAIAEAGSLNGAAKALGVQHTTVLRRLDALEQRLGARLFDRLRQGYTPTEAGELMAAQARQMRPAIAEMQRRILGRDLELQGSLRLTTAFIATLYLLPEALAAFRRSHPGIEVEVHENSNLVDMSRRDADVALRMNRVVPEHLVGRQVGEVRMRVYALRGAPGLPQTVQPVEDLCAHYPWIGFDRERRSRFFDRWMLDHVADERIVMRIDLLHPAVAMARTGVALALLPTLIEGHEPDLLPVSEVLNEVSTPVWLLTHPDLRQTARVRAFLQEVGTHLQATLAAAP